MRAFASTYLSLTPEAFRAWGRLALGGAFALGLLVLLLLTWAAPESLLPAFPVVLLGGAALPFLFRRPLLNLVVLLGAFILIASYEEGIQATEVLYGLYLLAFLAHWYGTRLLLYRERIAETAPEQALLLFLLLLPLTPFLTVLYGGSLSGLVSEAFSLSMLALYFPVKEACVRHGRRGVLAVLAVLIGIGLFAALRSFINYQEILVTATQEWQVAKGRVARSEALLIVPALLTLTLLIFARQARHRLVLLALFLACFGALILTQSRGYWLAFLFGAAGLFVVVERRYKGRLVLLGLAGLAGFLGFGLLFFGDYVVIILTSLAERFTSVGSAARTDVSLVNRFYESKAVLGYIGRNPLVGHGMGVQYRFYDLTFDYTRVDTFIHNGYVSLWFKFGLWGLALMLFAWLGAIWKGVQAFRRRAAEPLLRLAGLGAAVALLAFVLSANTSNPFYLNDTTFMFGVLMGLAGGAYRHGALFTSTPASAPSP